jgi:putrescine transport system substrate-binding protein
MKSIFARLALTALAAVGLVASASAADRVVNVYNWSDYIDDSILADFTKETGIKVVYDVYDSNETLEAKLLAGGTNYDVVVPTASFLQRQIAAGVYQKLDKSKIPNLSNMWTEITDRAQKYDPGNEYAVDYMWGTTGLGYNIDKMKAILGTDERPSWDILFKPEMAAKFKDCGIYMLDSPSDVLPSVLAYLGLDPDSRDPGDLISASSIPRTISAPWHKATSAWSLVIRATSSRPAAARKRQRTASRSAIRSPRRVPRCGST